MNITEERINVDIKCPKCESELKIKDGQIRLFDNKKQMKEFFNTQSVVSTSIIIELDIKKYLHLECRFIVASSKGVNFVKVEENVFWFSCRKCRRQFSYKLEYRV